MLDAGETIGATEHHLAGMGEDDRTPRRAGSIPLREELVHLTRQFGRILPRDRIGCDTERGAAQQDH